MEIRHAVSKSKLLVLVSTRCECKWKLIVSHTPIDYSGMRTKGIPNLLPERAQAEISINSNQYEGF